MLSHNLTKPTNYHHTMKIFTCSIFCSSCKEHEETNIKDECMKHNKSPFSSLLVLSIHPTNLSLNLLFILVQQQKHKWNAWDEKEKRIVEIKVKVKDWIEWTSLSSFPSLSHSHGTHRSRLCAPDEIEQIFNILLFI